MHEFDSLRTYLEVCDIIEKAKRYLKQGQRAPEGYTIQTGPRQGRYWDTEEHPGQTPPRSRVPAFRKQGEDLVHRTKAGEHGPGEYRIEYHPNKYLRKYDLFFKHAVTGEEKKLGSHESLYELKFMVRDWKKKGGLPKEEEKRPEREKTGSAYTAFHTKVKSALGKWSFEKMSGDKPSQSKNETRSRLYRLLDKMPIDELKVHQKAMYDEANALTQESEQYSQGSPEYTKNYKQWSEVAEAKRFLDDFLERREAHEFKKRYESVEEEPVPEPTSDIVPTELPGYTIQDKSHNFIRQTYDTESGEHGPGTYEIKSNFDTGEHVLRFNNQNGEIKYIKASSDIFELRDLVDGFTKKEDLHPIVQLAQMAEGIKPKSPYQQKVDKYRDISTKHGNYQGYVTSLKDLGISDEDIEVATKDAVHAKANLYKDNFDITDKDNQNKILWEVLGATHYLLEPKIKDKLIEKLPSVSELANQPEVKAWYDMGQKKGMKPDTIENILKDLANAVRDQTGAKIKARPLNLVESGHEPVLFYYRSRDINNDLKREFRNSFMDIIKNTPESKSEPKTPKGQWKPKNKDSHEIKDPADYRTLRVRELHESDMLDQAIKSEGGYYSIKQDAYVFPKESEEKIKKVAHELAKDPRMYRLHDMRNKPIIGTDAIDKRFDNMHDIVERFPGRSDSVWYSSKPSTTTRIDKKTGSHWYGSKFEVRPHEEGADLYYHETPGDPEPSLVAQGRQPHSNPKTRQNKNIKRLLAEAKYLEEEPEEIHNQIKNPRMIQKADTVRYIFNQIKKAISV